MRFKNYKNSYSGENRIYSNREIADMSVREAIKSKEAIMSQHRQIGIPSENELQSSENVVYVHAYTRDDGTEVKAHYRSKPESGSTVLNEIEKQTDVFTKENNINASEHDESLYVNESMPEIAGVKCGKPMSPEEAGGKNVNPGYESDDVGYKMNCTSCVPVHKAREMGYNLKALPARPGDNPHIKMMRRYPYYAFESKDGSNMEAPIHFRSNDVKECIKQVDKKIKKGQGYEFWSHPYGTEDGFAHTVEIYKHSNNKLEVYDPQSGKTYGKEYFYDIEYKRQEKDHIYYYPQYLFRIDNKKPKIDILQQISEPA